MSIPAKMEGNFARAEENLQKLDKRTFKESTLHDLGIISLEGFLPLAMIISTRIGALVSRQCFPDSSSHDMFSSRPVQASEPTR